ncbi:hypothetical protein [Pantoea sp. AS142]|uniref:hypothetical protein n=1 Tax=Pantoea sp. AS142 TaxID=3081292 RepID=UPI003017CFA0
MEIIFHRGESILNLRLSGPAEAINVDGKSGCDQMLINQQVSRNAGVKFFRLMQDASGDVSYAVRLLTLMGHPF